MLGGLHIEIAAFKALGKWVLGSRWPRVLTNTTVVSPGVANSFLAADAHVTRTRRAHQVTGASLHVLMKKACEEHSRTKRLMGQPNHLMN